MRDGLSNNVMSGFLGGGWDQGLSDSERCLQFLIISAADRGVVRVIKHSKRTVHSTIIYEWTKELFEK